jgi:hypothetical protein
MPHGRPGILAREVNQLSFFFSLSLSHARMLIGVLLLLLLLLLTQHTAASMLIAWRLDDAHAGE